MSATSPLLRPRDSDALRAEVRRIARLGEFPLVFGGTVTDDTLVLSEFAGARTNGLRGLAVARRSGLGGRVVDELRPASVADYRSASSITHHYDGPILGEQIRSVLAAPVIVAGIPRAVIYAANRDGAPVGDRGADALVLACGRLSTEITIRDEVDRRLRMADALHSGVTTEATAVAAGIRDIHADMRALADRAPDSALQRDLRSITERLSGILRGDDQQSVTTVTLSRREIDVLAQVSLGCSNIEAAQRLSLKPETVKSYLRSAMTKLDVRSRHSAVVAARRFGLLP